MKFNKSIHQYISGKKFSNGLSIPISKRESNIISRLKLIDTIIQNKNVIHLGCCDHIPLIEEKRRNDLWLHERITRIADNCLGVDINAKGIEYLKIDLGYNNIICADITQPNLKEIGENKWDYLVIGEILEHIDNPVSFLRKIYENYKNNIGKIIITVPNAFSFTNLRHVKKGLEIINTDHRYWFTPYTIAKTGHQAGLIMEEFFFVQENVNTKIGIKSKVLVIPFIRRRYNQYLLKKHPGLREGILAIFKFR